ncbi:hypothetical protein EKO04_000047 [Ascochyta lentis]|uniref:Uncharacterized protein n=1 Tax=Ascochyta lentis TaxID=205686 RepID=A0A8H7MNA2_9PLEO|nr:hypothetical protein EKO04_000047 [Ascochyta lentis]
MWSLEDHCRERGLVFEQKPSVPRAYSCSPPRTPKAPVHTLGFIVHDTPGAYESQNSYFPSITSDADDSAPSNSAIADSSPLREHDTFSADNNTEEPTFNDSNIEFDALELWRISAAKFKSDGECASPDTEMQGSPSEDTMECSGEDPSVFILQHAGSKVSCHDFDEYLISGPPSKRFKTLPTAIKNPVSSPLINSADPAKSIYHNAKNTSSNFLLKLLSSPKVNLVNEVTAEVYIEGVSLHMLEYFCGIDTITSLLFASNRSYHISVPPLHASKDGVVRVIRYMRRWCEKSSKRPTGEFHTPPGIKEGISTSLACRFFGLNADAERIEKLVLEDFMGNPRFFITDEDVELIWCHYAGKLRDSPFGDAIVWYVLEDVMSGKHALADEVRWMLEQEEYEDLKARVKDEMKKQEWRDLGRKEFLRLCQRARDLGAALGRVEVDNGLQNVTSPGEQGVFDHEKPLPRLPRTC